MPSTVYTTKEIYIFSRKYGVFYYHIKSIAFVHIQILDYKMTGVINALCGLYADHRFRHNAQLGTGVSVL
jgi:hypothetical protein